MNSTISRTYSTLVQTICDQNVGSLSIVNKSKNNFFSYARNEKIVFTLHEQKSGVKNNKRTGTVDNSPNGNKKGWFQQYKSSLIFSKVNKVINYTGRKLGNILPDNDKNRVLNSISTRGDDNITPRCTQASFEVKNLIKIVNKSLKNVNKEEWFQQENVSLLSSEVNKALDSVGEKFGDILTDNDKTWVFARVSTAIGVELDSRCTQSSITQILNNNKNFKKNVEGLYLPLHTREEKNKLKNLVTAKMTNIVYMRRFNGLNLEVVRTKAAEEIAPLIELKRQN